MTAKKSTTHWKQALTKEQYEVTQNSKTEKPFSGKYNFHEKTGVYHCVCCNNVLFDSTKKFDAGCGWPSFSDTAHQDAVIYKVDKSANMQRIEILCADCDAHLGHVFNDGPTITGKRYCTNSIALNFFKK